MQSIIDSESQRRSFRSQLSSQVSSKVGSTRASESLIAHPRSSSSREKPVVAVPLIPVNKKSSEPPRNSIASDRAKESQRTSIRNADHIQQQTSFDSEYPNIKLYDVNPHQNFLRQSDELSIRNKQLEESLQLEILRGEEQRAYIEVLKKSIEDNAKKSENQITREIEQNKKENNLMNECNRFYSEVSELTRKIETMRNSEKSLQNQNLMLKEKLTELEMEKELLENHLNHFQRNNETLGVEVKRLAEALYNSQQQCTKLEEENNTLIHQFEINKNMYVSKEEYNTVEKGFERMKQSYEDLQLLSEEIDKQRKISSKMLEEEARSRRSIEAEKESLLERLQRQDENVREKDRKIDELIKGIEEKSKLAEEFQQKFEMLTENYSILRMTLNENESELEKLKETIGNDTMKKDEMTTLQESNKELKEQITKLEELKKKQTIEKENIFKELKGKDMELTKLREELLEAIDNKERVQKESLAWHSENKNLLNKIKDLEKEIIQKETKIKDEDEDIDDLLIQNENREKIIRTLKDQIHLLEKENSLLKSSHDNSRMRNSSIESYKEENMGLMKKNEMFAKKLQDLGESQYALKIENENLIKQKEALRKELNLMEKGLSEIIETSTLHDDFESSNFKDNYSSKNKEWNSKKVQALLMGVRKEFERLNERYTLAKADLIKEMERCEEIERSTNKDSALRRENLALKEKIDNLNNQLSDLTKENNILKRSNENLSKK